MTRNLPLPLYLSLQAHRAATLRDALTLVEQDLDKDPDTRHATTHEVVQAALLRVREAAEALEHEAEVLSR